MSAAAPRAPATPATYAWEATDQEVAARHGIPIDRILRFDLNTAPVPPALAAEVLARGRWDPTLAEYPHADYRELVEAACGAYGVGADELLVGAGADEILDVLAKAFLPAGGVAVVPVPTYAMFRVVTEQRGGTVVPVPRRPASEGWAMDVDAMLDAASRADLVWLCSPNNPTALPEPDGSIESFLQELAARAPGGRTAAVVLDEAYFEFAGKTSIGLRDRYPNLVVVRTASKAYGLAGLRVGFAVASTATIARIAPYRPPASISTLSAAVVAAVMRHGTVAGAEVARVKRDRERLRSGLIEAGWSVGPSVTNFVLVDFGGPERSAFVAQALLRRGLVPRRFGAGQPLAGFLRLTVRDEPGNDRLLAAAREIDW